VRALITEPPPDTVVRSGELMVRGVAWSGAGPIAAVDVRVGDGRWQRARLIGERRRHSWQWWELLVTLDRSEMTSIRARATDVTGRTQPDRVEWNRLGYGNNAVQVVAVTVA